VIEDNEISLVDASGSAMPLREGKDKAKLPSDSALQQKNVVTKAVLCDENPMKRAFNRRAFKG
jgi:hypothetical protein